MTPPDRRRRLPLLGVVVAVLALVGMLAAGEAATGEPVSGVSSEALAGPDGGGSSFRTAETPAVVRATTNRLRPVGQVLPLVTVPAAALAALASARPVVAAAAPVQPRPAAVRHVRRRGPPALLVA